MKTLAHALGNLSFTYHPARDPFHNELDRKVVEDTINYVLYEREKASYDTQSRPNGEQGRKKAFKFEWFVLCLCPLASFVQAEQKVLLGLKMPR